MSSWEELLGEFNNNSIKDIADQANNYIRLLTTKSLEEIQKNYEVDTGFDITGTDKDIFKKFHTYDEMYSRITHKKTKDNPKQPVYEYTNEHAQVYDEVETVDKNGKPKKKKVKVDGEFEVRDEPKKDYLTVGMKSRRVVAFIALHFANTVYNYCADEPVSDDFDNKINEYIRTMDDQFAAFTYVNSLKIPKYLDEVYDGFDKTYNGFIRPHFKDIDQEDIIDDVVRYMSNFLKVISYLIASDIYDKKKTVNEYTILGCMRELSNIIYMSTGDDARFGHEIIDVIKQYMEFKEKKQTKKKAETSKSEFKSTEDIISMAGGESNLNDLDLDEIMDSELDEDLEDLDI